MTFQEYLKEDSIISSLDTPINFNGKDSSLKQLIDDKILVRKYMKQNEYNRNKFNKMDAEKQKEYMTKLKNSRNYFIASKENDKKEWDEFKISKSLFDTIKLPEDPFVDQYKEESK